MQHISHRMVVSLTLSRELWEWFFSRCSCCCKSNILLSAWWRRSSRSKSETENREINIIFHWVKFEQSGKNIKNKAYLKNSNSTIKTIKTIKTKVKIHKVHGEWEYISDDKKPSLTYLLTYCTIWGNTSIVAEISNGFLIIINNYSGWCKMQFVECFVSGFQVEKYIKYILNKLALSYSIFFWTIHIEIASSLKWSARNVKKSFIFLSHSANGLNMLWRWS